MSKSQSSADSILKSEQVTTEQARQQLEDTILEAVRSRTNTLILAPTSLGKSHTTSSFPWGDYPEVTGGQPVVVLHQTRTARDDAADVSRDHGLDVLVLKGREDVCPVAAGKHDDELNAIDGLSPSEWFEQKCDVENVEFSFAHRRLSQMVGGLPCCDDGDCESITQWSRLARTVEGDDSVDIVHATESFARVDWLIEDANLIFDEQPTYTESLPEKSQENLRRAVADLINVRVDAGMSYEGLISAVERKDTDSLSRYRDVFAEDPPRGWLFSKGNVHASTAEIGRALTNAEHVGNNRYRGVDGSTTVLLDERRSIYVHQPPDLSKTRCVIGLDAHPNEYLWKLNTVDDLTTVRVLSELEQRYWRLHERQLHIVQVGNATNYCTQGWKSKTVAQKATRVIEEIRDHYGEEFRTAITSKSLKDEVREILRAAGVEDPETLHYNKLRSRNDFKDESVGLLVGCIDPGDDYVLNMLALCDLRAKVTRENGKREFVGPDGDAATEFVKSVRENNVAQAAGRYARRPDDKEDSAIVYAFTDAIPEELVDETVPGVTGTVTQKKREIEEYVRGNSPVTTTDIVENVTSSRKHVLDTLGEMEEQGLVSKSVEARGSRIHVYHYEGGTFRRPVNLGF